MTTTLRFLITGFQAFGVVAHNPSERLIQTIPANSILGVELSCMALPVAYDIAPELLRNTILEAEAKGQPFDAVLMLGVAFRSEFWRVEQYGINSNGATPDIFGTVSEPIIQHQAPNVLTSSMPIEKILESLQQAGFPSCLSNSAGNYLCNHLYYHALWFAHLLEQEGKKAPKMGFLHIPADEKTREDLDGIPYFPFSQHLAALNVTLTVIRDSLQEEARIKENQFDI